MRGPFLFGRNPAALPCVSQASIQGVVARPIRDGQTKLHPSANAYVTEITDLGDYVLAG